MTALGIIAGAGELPVAIAECASEAGKSVFIVALQGIADPEVARFAHGWVSLGAVGQMTAVLHQNNCGEVLLAGKGLRPRWAGLRLAPQTMLQFPQRMGAGPKGGDGLRRGLVGIIESAGVC